MRILFATRITCDWPECKSVGDIGSEEVTLAGWAYLPDGLNLDGAIRRDFCSIHACATLAQLAEKVGKQ